MSENERKAVRIDISGDDDIDLEADGRADGMADGMDSAKMNDDEVEILDFVDADDDFDSAAGGDEGLVEVDGLRAELADLKDRSMRTLADFDNFRKRAERERGEIRRHAVAEVVRDFLEVVDNLERALAAGGSADDLKTGVQMILRQLDDVLRRQGVERVASIGERFDPTHHEAVSRQEDRSVEEPRVVEEMQAGYRLHDKLLRAARVVVAVPPEEN